jgi:hypothetical protein
MAKDRAFGGTLATTERLQQMVVVGHRIQRKLPPKRHGKRIHADEAAAVTDGRQSIPAERGELPS